MWGWRGRRRRRTGRKNTEAFGSDGQESQTASLDMDAALLILLTHDKIRKVGTLPYAFKKIQGSIARVRH